ncbi:hypothetical protein Taro_007261 [Colocasia esculenta]|uniref:Water stress and hypersensitive response domain-containing protein n=1 Tax=Colocasia esculenta TaxID=4460 RepID=A0A843TYG6_COLES|nr:hypothetical protein [Colocasia esculenta]
MASTDKPVRMEIEGEKELAERGTESFLDKVKDFVHDIGDKLEEAISLGKPDATLSAVHFTSLDPHHAHLLLDVLVANTNSAPISLPDLRYLLDSNGRKLASGSLPHAGAIAPHGSEVVKLPLVLSYDDVRSAHPDIHPGSVIPYSVALEIAADVPDSGKVTLRVKKDGELPVPQAPQVDLRRVGLDKVSLEEVSATLHLKVGNRNDFDLGVNAVECEVWLGGVSLGKETLRMSAVVVKHGNGVVQVPVKFRPSELGSAVWEVVRGRGAVYAMKGSLDADTPFGAMKLPFGKDEGSTKLRKADDDDEDSDDGEKK